MNSLKELSKIANVLASLFTQSSTPEEEKAYREWTDRNPAHQKVAKRILTPHIYEENYELIKSFSPQSAWKKIHPLLGKSNSSTFFSWKRSFKYAALILLLIAPAYYFLLYNEHNSKETIDIIAPGSHGGELTLSNGNTFNISGHTFPEGSSKVFVINSDGINYHTPTNKFNVKEIPNTLRTLKGMECHITLSDGTEVHLNAESQLSYPVCFSNKERVVKIEGEAYFDVVPDAKHPFIIQTNHNAIKVTGTSFNVRAYADEPTESTTLVNGSITVSNRNEKFNLVPGQHFSYNKTLKQCTVATVKTELYTSWKSGSFLFMNIPLENVMSYLSKWYDFKYSFDDETARHICIGAYLNRYENMNPIINMIEKLNRVDIKQKEGILHISHKE